MVEFVTGGCFGAELGNPFLDMSLFPALLRTFYVMSKNHVIQIVMTQSPSICRSRCRCSE